MINKTRKKFVVMTMVLLASVFAVILSAVILGGYFSFSYGVTRLLTERLEYVRENRTIELGVDSFDLANEGRTFIAVRYQQDEWRVNYSQDFFEDEEVQRYLQTFHQENEGCGHVKEVYYVYDVVNNWSVIVAMDASIELSQLEAIVWLGVVIICMALLFLYIIVALGSWWIIKPMSIAFNKQKQFVADASHELKTPLTIINANVDALCSDIGDNKWTENILSQTKRMNGLVVDLLTLAKLEEGQSVVSHQVDLSSTVKNSVLSFEALAFESGKSLQIDVEDDVKLMAVEQEVQQLVSILMDNAIKYGDKGTPIKAKLSSHPLQLSISNGGATFGDYEEEKVFERFWRSDQSRDRKTGGSGLGLSIAKGICDKNKWKIKADSQDDKVTFTISF